jgi:hypothetical protein
MKAALALLAAAPLIAVQPDEAPAPLALDNPSYQEPARQWRSIEDAGPQSDNCRDTIRHVREANGQPAFRKENAVPGEPLLIAAVDQRIDGCSVMVMRQNTGDVRPLPPPHERPAKLIPAR